MFSMQGQIAHILCFTSLCHQRRQWHPTPALLPGKSHGWRSLAGCSPWGRWGSGTTERLHFHLSLSCIGEGNGNPLQCSCLENPRDGGAWWAAVYGVAQSRTRLKRLSSSGISLCHNYSALPPEYESGYRQCLNEWAGLGSHGSSFTERNRRLDLAPGLQFANSCSRIKQKIKFSSHPNTWWKKVSSSTQVT